MAQTVRHKHSRLNLATDYSSPTGSPIHVKYGWSRVDGELAWVEKEKINLFEIIQAARESCDLKAILERYAAGDDSVLNKVQGMYYDTVAMPKNYAELYDSVQRCTDIFDNMPVEIKSKFNNDPARFWKMSGTNEFDQIINEWRSNVLNAHGIDDENPIKTAPEVKIDE